MTNHPIGRFFDSFDDVVEDVVESSGEKHHSIAYTNLACLY
ncbi:hypothetical protein [Methylocaldum szegediense]|nr:hypothetical protein [Methylocaldum szegediense]